MASKATRRRPTDPPPCSARTCPPPPPPLGSDEPSVSDDGRFVAFTSGAPNLDLVNAPLDTNPLVQARDVFVRDIEAGTTQIVSAPAAGQSTACGTTQPSGDPAISGDGRYVAFWSRCRLLPETGGTSTSRDVFRWDRVTGELRHVNLKLDGITLGTTNSGTLDPESGEKVSISQDGSHVAFTTCVPVSAFVSGAAETPRKADIFPTCTGSVDTQDVIVREMSAPAAIANQLVSHADDNPLDSGDADSVDPSLSSNGSVASYATEARNVLDLDLTARLDSSKVIVRADLAPGQNSQVDVYGDDRTSSGSLPALSGDGSVIGFSSGNHPYVRDMGRPFATDVAVFSGPKERTVVTSDSGSVSVSEDGRFIGFRTTESLSEADSLRGVDEDDVYVRDLLNLTTFLVSRATGITGAPGDDTSFGPVISGNGEYVAFTSKASSFGPHPPNSEPGVYRRQVREPPLPVEGTALNVRPVVGDTAAAEPGGALEVLDNTSQLPVGTLVDSSDAKLEITSTNDETRTQTGFFTDGIYVVTQPAGADPYTELTLAGPLECIDEELNAARRVSAKKRARKRRRVFGHTDGGRFLTRGRYGSAGVRGTAWEVEDLCDESTLFTVTEGGPVDIDDFSLAPPVDAVLSAGDSYTARPGPESPAADSGPAGPAEPNTRIVLRPAARTPRTAASFRFRSIPTGADFKCRVDDRNRMGSLRQAP